MTAGRADHGPTGGTMTEGPRTTGEPPPDRPAPAGASAARRTVRIVNPLGLHHRVADRFARACKGLPAAVAVAVTNADVRADGRSLWDLLGLVALPGQDVVLDVTGPGADAHADALADILAAEGGEDYTI